MPRYDFIVAGGGAAGLSLAYHLSQSPLGRRSILVVDRDGTERSDRTWCYWTDRSLPFDSLVYRRWSRLRVVSERCEDVLDPGPYRYEMIRGVDLYRFVLHELEACMQVEVVQGSVDRIDDGRTEAGVWVDGRNYAARWVFDSRPAPIASTSGGQPARRLWQHFTGWNVSVDRPSFTPRVATLMDFRTAQAGGLRFFYVLPSSEYEAIVEYVTCTDGDCFREEHEHALKDYLGKRAGSASYKTERREGGTTLLTDRAFPRRLGNCVMAIGAPGGRIKPTTGYAFTRIQRDSAAIVESLQRAGHPFDVPPDSWRYRRYDAALFDVMLAHDERIKPILVRLFHRNSLERIFRFLDEQALPWDDLRIAASLPPEVSLRAVFRR